MNYFSTFVRVTYGDTDQMGIVYHANYLKYFEVSRTEMLRSKGLAYRELEAEGVLLQVVKCAMEFHRPACYDDLLEVRSTVTQVGKASLVIASQVWRDGQMLATGEVKLASVARKTGRIAPLTERLLKAIDDFRERP